MHEVNEHGVVINPEVIINYNDGKISFYLERGFVGDRVLYGYGYQINSFGEFSGMGSPACLAQEDYLISEDYVLNYIYKGLYRNLRHNENGLKHLERIKIFNKVKHQSLF